MLHNSSKLVMQRGSDDSGGGAHSAPPCGQAAQAHSPNSHDAATLPTGARGQCRKDAVNCTAAQHVVLRHCHTKQAAFGMA
jgi:hypothetical protein